MKHVLFLLTLFVFVGCSTNPERTDSAVGTSDDSVSSQDRCALPEDAGPCEARMVAWRFDASSKTCVQFNYGGCEGNANNFPSAEACQSACNQ